MEHLQKQVQEAYEEHADAIFRYCYFKLSDNEKAKDVVQDTFVRVWQYLSEGKNIDSIKPFLYTTARNLIIDEYRKKKSSSLDTLMEGGFEPGIDIRHELETRSDALQVIKSIQELPKSYSEILFMRYVDDLSVKEIAQTLGESENVISVRIYRGLAKLRTNLQPYE
jgi:RNA polymerase sigma-70 factor (ECF subfamily)